MPGQPKVRAKVAALIAKSGGEISVRRAKRMVRSGIASRVIADLTRAQDVGAQPARPAMRAPSRPAPPQPKPRQTMATNDLDGIVSAITGAADGGDTNKVFMALREEALRFALEIMRMPLDPDERSFSKMLGVKQQITQAVLTATARVRPGDLRDRDDDGVGALLALVKAEGAEPGRVLTAAEMLD